VGQGTPSSTGVQATDFKVLLGGNWYYLSNAPSKNLNDTSPFRMSFSTNEKQITQISIVLTNVNSGSNTGGFTYTNFVVNSTIAIT
jgi:hypothetical protein